MAGKTVKAKNRLTGVSSSFTEEQWAKMQKDPNWSGVYIREKEKSVPDEVKDLVKNQKKIQTESHKTEDVSDKK